MNVEQELAKLLVEMEHIKETVETIDRKLEASHMGSRLAVLEDRQRILFRLVNGTIAFFATIVSGLFLWIFTH